MCKKPCLKPGEDVIGRVHSEKPCARCGKKPCDGVMIDLRPPVQETVPRKPDPPRKVHSPSKIFKPFSIQPPKKTFSTRAIQAKVKPSPVPAKHPMTQPSSFAAPVSMPVPEPSPLIVLEPSSLLQPTPPETHLKIKNLPVPLMLPSLNPSVTTSAGPVKFPELTGMVSSKNHGEPSLRSLVERKREIREKAQKERKERLQSILSKAAQRKKADEFYELETQRIIDAIAARSANTPTNTREVTPERTGDTND